MNDKEWNDYVVGNSTGVNMGSVYGQVGADQYNQRQSLYNSTSGTPVNTGGGAGSSLDNDFLFVDDLFERLPPWVEKLLIVLGVLAGAGFGLYLDGSWGLVALFAISGGVFGALLINLAIYVIKIVLALVILAATLWIGYLALQYFFGS